LKAVMTMAEPHERPILVAYASKHGSTAEIAERIASTMRASGCDAHAVDADEVKDLSEYRAVVLGSALYVKRLQGSARHFAHRHRDALRDLPVWLFTSGPVDLTGEDDKVDEPRSAVTMAARLGARGHVMFGGRLPVDPHNFVERAMVESTPPGRRDSRDWDAVEAWARSIAEELTPTAAGQPS
jgi:menaquinone-dependent protoporphyrinogen oxidase